MRREKIYVTILGIVATAINVGLYGPLGLVWAPLFIGAWYAGTAAGRRNTNDPT